MKINYNVTGAKRKELAQTIGTALDLKPKYMGMPSAAYQIGSFTLSKDGVLDYFESTDIEDVRKVLDAITAAGFEPAEPEEAEAGDESEEPEETAAAVGTEPQEGSSEATPVPPAEESIEDAEETEAAADDDPTTLSISLPDNLSDEAFSNLEKILSSKQTLMRHAFLSEGITVTRKDGQIVFSGFTASDGDHTDAYLRYITLLTKFSKEAKRVTGKDYPVENEKFAFRCFIIRIGMIGSEYKKARKILLENLTGNSSWKNGAPEKNPPAATEESAETAAESGVAVNE